MDEELLYEETAARVRATPSGFPDIVAIAEVAGVSGAALHQLFRDHAHESPDEFLRRVRVEHACHMLASGAQLAAAVSDDFVASTGLTPDAWAALANTSEFVLRLPQRYRFREVLDFYGRDLASVSEQVSGTGLRKALLIDGQPALIEIRFEGDSAVCRVDAADHFSAHKAIARMLGIHADASGFESRFAADPLLGALLQRQRGLRIPLTPQPWEALAWAIMGQQISLKVAVALRRELISAHGLPHATSGLRAHPSAETVAGLDVESLRKLKFSRAKAEYLIAAAQAVASHQIPIDNLRNLSAHRAARLLGSVRGIGPWTVQYAFLRGVGFANCLPSGDAGLAQGLAHLSGARPAEPQIREMMARFAPWRSLATYHVWASLKGDPIDAV
jgi:AraC family transcriptional regulator, regulatory protein of adaptative response / DNA-3-methyladenine glycosylase II